MQSPLNPSTSSQPLLSSVLFKKIMEGELVKEVEVSAAASAVWEIYGSLELIKLTCEVNPMVTKFEVLEGDGGVGTITQGWLMGGKSFREKIIKIDNEKRLKETEMLEGALLDQGFSLSRARYEIFEKEANSCIIKITIEYKVESEARIPLTRYHLQTLRSMAAAIGRRLCEKEKLTL